MDNVFIAAALSMISSIVIFVIIIKVYCMTRSLSEIIPGLYLGNLTDAQNMKALKHHNITHILSVIDKDVM